MLSLQLRSNFSLLKTARENKIKNKKLPLTRIIFQKDARSQQNNFVKNAKFG